MAYFADDYRAACLKHLELWKQSEELAKNIRSIGYYNSWNNNQEIFLRQNNYKRARYCHIWFTPYIYVHSWFVGKWFHETTMAHQLGIYRHFGLKFKRDNKGWFDMPAFDAHLQNLPAKMLKQINLYAANNSNNKWYVFAPDYKEPE